MHHCLNTDELLRLIEQKGSLQMDDRDLQCFVESAENWQDELSAHTYFMCRILERKAKHNGNRIEMITRLYALPDEMLLCIQELDSQFISHMLQHVRRADIRDLAEELIEFQRDIREHRYAAALRY